MYVHFFILCYRKCWFGKV